MTAVLLFLVVGTDTRVSFKVCYCGVSSAIS